MVKATPPAARFIADFIEESPSALLSFSLPVCGVERSTKALCIRLKQLGEGVFLRVETIVRGGGWVKAKSYYN